MAKEMGLGVTPWSPLKFGILTGKYSRENKGKVDPARGDWVLHHLGKEKTYEVIDALMKVAQEVDSTPARVALAWVQARSGVTSSIIGARRKEQLLDNLGCLEIKLSQAQIQQLDAVSAPTLNFPHDFLKGAGVFMAAETTINGETNGESKLAPKSDAERFDRLEKQASKV